MSTHSNHDNETRADQQVKLRLKATLLLYATIGILLTGAVVALVSILPLYDLLKSYEDSNLRNAAGIRALAVTQYLAKLEGTALQITSRTRIRDQLEEYNHGQLSLAQLVAFTQPKLEDALHLSADAVGMVRFDHQGQPVVRVGKQIPPGLLTLDQPEPPASSMRGPVQIEGQPYLLVQAPILDREAHRVGTDLVLFQLDNLRTIIADPTGLGRSGETILGGIVESQPTIFFPLRDQSPAGAISAQSLLGNAFSSAGQQQEREIGTLLSTDQKAIVAFTNVAGTDWVLAIKMDRDELYADPNRQVSWVIVTIISLIILGTGGMALLLRPLAGRILIGTDRLEREVQAKTSALEEVESAKRKVDDIIASIADGLIVCDRHGRVLLMNQVARELFDLASGEVTAQPLADLIAPSPLCEEMTRVLEVRQPHARQIDLRQEVPGQQPPRLIRARISLMLDTQNQPSGTVTTLSDLTRELELDRLKNEFISRAAHELNTPLAVITGFAELLLTRAETEAEQTERTREFAGEILAKAGHLTELVDDLLDVSRIQAGMPPPLQSAPTDIGELLAAVVRQFRILAPRRDFQLELPETTAGMISLDRQQITGVLENLLGNAAKYSQEGSRITVKGEDHGDCYQVAVTDHGRGIEPEHLAKVFEKFYRIDSSNTAPPGLGLGLSLARQMVEAHGGKIWLESVPGQGTTVTFTLPRPGSQG